MYWRECIRNLLSQFGLHQMINYLTHMWDTYFSLIDFIFTSQLNLVVESGVHPSLNPNYHDQIILAKFNLNIRSSPLYYCQVWHYEETDTELIRQAIDLFNFCSIAKKLFKILMSLRKLLSVIELFSIFFTILFHIKHC